MSVQLVTLFHHIFQLKEKQIGHCSFQIENAPEGSTWSVSGWTKQGIAFLLFTKSFFPKIGSDRPQLLILDGHDSQFCRIIRCSCDKQNTYYYIYLVIERYLAHSRKLTEKHVKI